ncbi:MAG: glycosyltransferase [Pseudomonadota bacterium]
MIAPDLVVAEYSALGPILDLVGTPQARKAILLHDLFSLRARATLDHQLSTDVKGFTLEEEAALCAHADILIYASKSERAIFKEYLPDRAHVWLAPSCKPLADIPPSGAPKALFMGVKHLGNLDAIAFLMTEIWPDVVAQKPDAELWIVGEIGSFLEPEWISLPGVKVLGVVKDLTSLGGADTLGLAPTRVGSGVSIKIADYLRLGMTAIASKTAMEGYGQTLDQSVHLAETAKEFSDKIVACLNREADAYHSGQRISFRESELRTVLKSAFRHDA